jgi:hypothetical protein
LPSYTTADAGLTSRLVEFVSHRDLWTIPRLLVPGLHRVLTQKDANAVLLPRYHGFPLAEAAALGFLFSLPWFVGFVGQSLESITSVSRRLPKRRYHRKRECQRERDFCKLPNVIDTDGFLIFHP